MITIKDTYQKITDQIIEQLEAGVRPWVQEWRTDTPGISATPLRASGDAYRGINTLMLWLARRMNGYGANTWLTFKQAVDLGGMVRKGETGHLVVKYGTFSPKGADAGVDPDRKVPFLKGYVVFNVDQIGGLPEHFYPSFDPAPHRHIEPLATVERFVEATGARVTFAGSAACYRPVTDDILMPDRRRFTSQTGLYSTWLHEVVHWSGAPHRLDRDLKNRFGSQAYAAEELVAEMASAFLCADLRVPHDPQGNTAAYIDDWLAVLRSDKRAIFTAAAKAQQAADYLHGLQGEQPEISTPAARPTAPSREVTTHA